MVLFLRCVRAADYPRCTNGGGVMVAALSRFRIMTPTAVPGGADAAVT
jgi:hypothetical protein